MPWPPALSTLLLGIPPLALLAVWALGRLEPGARPRRLRAALPLLLALAGAATAVAGLHLLLEGPAVSPWLGAGDLGLAFRLDGLSWTLTALVVFVAAVVLRYGMKALEGDPRRGRFVGDLAFAASAVLLLVSSAHLLGLVLGWLAVGMTLHGLLLFRAERPGARRAARMKFFFARLGDATVVLAALLLARAFGTADVGAILEAARTAAGGAVPPAATAAAYLIVLAAVLKSVQFPAHVWLPEAMDTPTPVSALLHAGIVNAGGFLVLRFADVVLLAPGALLLLLLAGGFTAVFGSLVMTVQTNVKGKLAWSTIAQMGLMTFQLGLGAFPLALLHIVAHSLYKAHAFLTAGSGVRADLIRAAPPRPLGRALGARLAALALAAGTFLALAALARIDLAAKPGAAFLALVLVLGIHPLLAAALEARRAGAVARALLATALLAALYLLATGLFLHAYGPVLPAAPPLDTARLAVAAATLLLFAALALLPAFAALLVRSERASTFRVHVRSGFYVGALLDRLLAWRLRPAPALAPGDER